VTGSDNLCAWFIGAYPIGNQKEFAPPAKKDEKP